MKSEPLPKTASLLGRLEYPIISDKRPNVGRMPNWVFCGASLQPAEDRLCWLRPMEVQRPDLGLSGLTWFECFEIKTYNAKVHVCKKCAEKLACEYW
jgi:hypothetical protein